MKHSTSNGESTESRSFGIHNPAMLTADELLEEFVARRDLLDDVLDTIRGNRRDEPQQHLLFLGARGMGKTMMMHAIAHSIERDSMLKEEWVPVVFPEEVYYGVADLADFWLEANAHLLGALERDEGDLDELRLSDPAGLEERARNHLLEKLDELGKRVIFFVENLGDFFGVVSDLAEQHRLRAFLMSNDRVMLIGSATSYFEAVVDIDKPFFDFFRTIDLLPFNSEEMSNVLRCVADARGDQHVLDVLDAQPQRVQSLHVLTGGNPRLIKLVYRMLHDGGAGDARRDLNRLLDDCTPYFKHRIESLSGEQRRLFDRVARKWDPVAVRDLEADLRRPSNRISALLGRLVEQGFVDVAPGSTETRKRYQVAERFYNIYYLMRFSRVGRQRLEWLTRFMSVLYSTEDYRQWATRILSAWKDCSEGTKKEEHVQFLHALLTSVEDRKLRHELTRDAVKASWDADQLSSLYKLLDKREVARTLGSAVPFLEFLRDLSREEQSSLGYRPEEANWWRELGRQLEREDKLELAEEAMRRSIELKPDYAYGWVSLGFLLMTRLQRFDDAENAYDEAIRLDPREASAWLWRARNLSHQGRYQESLSSLEEAIRLEPSDAYSHGALGDLLGEHLKEYARAEVAYRFAISQSGNSAVYKASLAKLLNARGRRDEARFFSIAAVRMEPDSKWFRLLFLQICGENNEAWQEILPSVMSQVATADEEVLEFAVQGVQRLLIEGALDCPEAVRLIEAAGAQEPLSEMLLALRAAENPSLLDTVAPERRIVAQDFLDLIASPVE